MSRAGAFTSSMYQRHGAYHFQDALRHKAPLPQASGSTQIIVGLNALWLLVVMSWVVFARLRRRVLRMLCRLLDACLQPVDFEDDCMKQLLLMLEKDPEGPAVPAASGEGAAIVAEGAGDAAASGDDEAEDDDLEDYEIIRNGDAIESDVEECSDRGQPA